MLNEASEYLNRIKAESRLVRSRLTLARLAVVFEGRVDKANKIKSRQAYRMCKYHLEMIQIVAQEAGINSTAALRKIINEWYEYKREEMYRS